MLNPNPKPTRSSDANMDRISDSDKQVASNKTVSNTYLDFVADGMEIHRPIVLTYIPNLVTEAQNWTS